MTRVRALLALLSCAIALPTWAASAFVQAADNSTGLAGTTVATGAFGASVTAGSGIFWAYVYSSTASKTVTCTRSGDTVVELGSGAYDATYDFGIHYGYIQNAVSGTTQVSCTASASVDFQGVIAAEYSGVATSGLVGSGEHAGQFVNMPGTGTDAFTSGNITPAQQPFMLVSVAVTYNVYGNLTAGTSFTNRGSMWDFQFAIGDSARHEDQRRTSTSAIAGTFTLGSNDAGFVVAAAFREPSTSALPEYYYRQQRD